ncbi:aconitate hydratase [Alkalispirochaeta sphaeroplastigenens]|uniref:Aconitate hydratase n=1 Tax=Alkalispirochaeta sphaeroplastigenens TaxID=1187066 RepID=A0A2S4JG61_9SPIO|nr:aconitate hydratase AcnA [Alkalispirochaeta sphaeroplastigenens]POQ98547.1 aconitate hydratase [Alkalispirochaeta sphaeroplastigenens]
MKSTVHTNSFGVRRSLDTPLGEVSYFSLEALANQGFPGIERLPFSLRVLLESVLRNEDGFAVTGKHIESLASYCPANPAREEIPYKPARVLLQDFTGVPSVVDLAAMRSAMARLGKDPASINPQLPVDLVIDHSVQVDYFNSPGAHQQNTDLEFSRNRERYEFLRWGQGAFRNFSVIPPASGICHQVNLEYLGKVVQIAADSSGGKVAFFDSLVGTDSHTPMINGLGIIGWGVGGIEAEAAMLGQPVYILSPAVVGVRITGELRQGITATDLVLRVTEMLREHGVVGKFVEFFGPGLEEMTVPDRATISNMAPEYGATMGFFPVDQRTLDYLWSTGRSEELIRTVELYCRAQGMFRTVDSPDPDFETVLHLDLGDIQASLAGPKRPQDRIAVSSLKESWQNLLTAPVEERGFGLAPEKLTRSAPLATVDVAGEGAQPGTSRESLTHGDVVIASITSCTNTSNPSVLLGAALLAKKAWERGLRHNPWVKTSFAPGSVVVTEYLQRAGLMEYLEKMGFFLVGYGCLTCIGNSGPLPAPVARAVEEGDLVVAGVLSGNRNFEGRINPHTRANFLASPQLVVAYALAGTVNINLEEEPLGHDETGNPVYLREIWPTGEELREYLEKALDRDAFIASYRGIEESNTQWNAIPASQESIYPWSETSTYIQEPPFFQEISLEVRPVEPVQNAPVLVMAGDSITTDHISPAGAIDPASPAGEYLQSLGVTREEFNSYGSRRGNDRIMTRGTFANIRFRNLLVPGTEGSRTIHMPTGEEVSIFEAARRYGQEKTPTIILAGKDYGMGSSRDWAAKGTYLLGVRAVIAESYERIHRSNLVGMGVLPLQFLPGESVRSLGLSGRETFSIAIDDSLEPGQTVTVTASADGEKPREFSVLCRIDTPVEVVYYRNGGILPTVLRALAET